MLVSVVDETRRGAQADPTWDRLEEQIRWYGDRSHTAQVAYKRTKIAQLISAAAIPVLATAGVASVWTAAAGGALLVLEGVQQLFQWQTNWVLYRSTAELLKHERYLYLAGAGPYASAERHRVLAERLEGLVSQEHAKWTETREEGESPRPKPVVT